ncbi:MAG: uroporphyrinogen decarboxylase family protein [Lacunisphaera sp.]|nr:uroporphyrinogen decarboxylase family protein [Lacunisphaera sp.]
MSPKQRLVAALDRRPTDHLPATTHHLMRSYMDKYHPGKTDDEFFAAFGLDPICWVQAHRPDPASGAFYEPEHVPGFLEARRITSATWRFEHQDVPGREFPTVRHAIVTPRKTLTMELQSNEYTAWVSERLIKEPSDIELIAEFAPQPLCDPEPINRLADRYGDTTLIRGNTNCFDLYGQPGCWQDACVLYGVEEMILATYDDPAWVHRFLRILCDRKVRFVDSMKGARYDLIEHGGGDASSTVISPKVFDEFVAPYDREVIAHARAAGQRVVYHTCGGMMPILERLVALGSNALETFTPPAMGGDMDLAEAKRRIGDQVCFIGGFDQNRYFTTATPEETRAEVRRCFHEAGAGGGFILSPSDHFFEAKPELLHAFADEARRCTY